MVMPMASDGEESKQKPRYLRTNTGNSSRRVASMAPASHGRVEYIAVQLAPAVDLKDPARWSSGKGRDVDP